MDTSQRKPRKVRTTLAITRQAQDIMLNNGYASARTMGEFISSLIVDYHKRLSSTLTPLNTADPKIE